MGRKSAVVSVLITGAADGVKRAAAQANAALEGTGKKVGALSGKAKLAFAAGGTAALAFAGDSIQAYKDAQVAQAQLEGAYKRFPQLAGGNVEVLRKLNSELAKKTTYDDDATASAQATLATFGYTEDQLVRLTPLLQDYAARTGKDLPAAAKQLGKAGMGKSLKDIGLVLKDTGDQSKNFEQLVTGLQAKVGGAAEEMGGTGAGKVAILKNQFGELQELVGSKLLPGLTSLAGAGMTALGWLENPAIRNGALVLAALATGIVAVNVAHKAWTATTAAWSVVQQGATAAQAAFNAVLAANPIVLVVAGIAALAAGIFLAYKKVGWFHAAVDAGWQALQRLWDKALGAAAGVKGALSGAFDWVRGHWPLLLGILTGPFGLAIVGIVKHKDKILGALKAIPDAAKRLFSGLSSTITAPFRAAVDAIRHLWNSTIGGKGFSVPDWPGVPHRGESYKIPRLAKGAIIERRRGGILANIGEGPNDEAVIPLPPGWRHGAGAAAAQSSAPAEIKIYTAADPQAVVEAIKRWIRHNGPLPAGFVVQTS